MTLPARNLVLGAQWALISLGFVSSAWAEPPTCKPGDELAPNGKCMAPCPPGLTRQQKPDGSVVCAAPPPSNPCKPGDEPGPNGKCIAQCPPGLTRQQKPDGSLICATPPPSNPCKPGDEPGPNGKCIAQCPAGQTHQQKPDGSLQCVATPPAPDRRLPPLGERLR